MKNLSRFISLLILCFLLTVSCEEYEQQALQERTGTSQALDKGVLAISEGPGETLLGKKLENPYALANVRAAAALLGENTKEILPTHYYIEFTPENGEQVAALEDYAEENGYEFEIQPIHYEVLYEGEEGYYPLEHDEEGIVPEYGAVTATDFTEGKLPEVPYKVLDVMHLSEYETLLTFTAFVISGNEKYYEAVDGFCHPDCPSWPICLDQPEFTCRPPKDIPLETIKLTSTIGREKFPDYVLDDKMGADGQAGPIKECLNIVNPQPDCPKGCSPVLVPIPDEPDACRWECQCDPGSDDDGGDDGGGNPQYGARGTMWLLSL